MMTFGELLVWWTLRPMGRWATVFHRGGEGMEALHLPALNFAL